MDLRNLRGLDLDLPAIIDLFGKEKVIDTIGQEKVVETIGRDNVLATLFPNLTKEQIKKLIEQNGGK